ncbi:MAG: hypothetical protein AAAB20_21470 [Rhizobium sp.]|uniref:hypothetical protein n=1 Tax=Rhizobium sp. TaxID=391 RepID=UPI0006488FC8
MLEECIAGTGIAQIIGWDSERLENRELIDLLPAWQGKRFALLLHSAPAAENQRTNFGWPP